MADDKTKDRRGGPRGGGRPKSKNPRSVARQVRMTPDTDRRLNSLRRTGESLADFLERLAQTLVPQGDNDATHNSPPPQKNK